MSQQAALAVSSGPPAGFTQEPDYVGAADGAAHFRSGGPLVGANPAALLLGRMSAQEVTEKYIGVAPAEEWAARWLLLGDEWMLSYRHWFVVGWMFALDQSDRDEDLSFLNQVGSS
jgi:hypothetical protein